MKNTRHTENQHFRKLRNLRKLRHTRHYTMANREQNQPSRLDINYLGWLAVANFSKFSKLSSFHKIINFLFFRGWVKTPCEPLAARSNNTHSLNCHSSNHMGDTQGRAKRYEA